MIFLEDQTILDLYFQRSEQAIQETDRKYGGYCYSIAFHILENRQDSEESVSDTYWKTWNAIPPKRPNILSAYLAKLTRYIAIDKWRKSNTQKRGSGQMRLALDELELCADPSTPEKELEHKELQKALNRFVGSLPETERNVFLCRYWYLDSIGAIAQATGFSESKVASMLLRTRKKLRRQLSEEGF